MPGTIVILSDMVDLGRPPRRGNVPYRRAATDLFVKIDGPGDYQMHDVTSDHYEVEPGTYRVRAHWTYYHSNSVSVEVSEGGRHYVRFSPTMFYSLTTIPLVGALPQLIETMIPGSGMRAAISHP
jgi:hypothetical protein